MTDERCETCRWWKQDFGTFTATGWTGMDRNEGHCHFERRRIAKRGDDCCHDWHSDKRQAKPEEEPGTASYSARD